MWYVNKVHEEVVEDIQDGFILTMWYVNCKNGSIVFCSPPGFILTMWYVNHSLHWLITSYFATFYINYVVCKL